MNRLLSLFVLLVLTAPLLAQEEYPIEGIRKADFKQRNVLWYNKPAKVAWQEMNTYTQGADAWMEYALPIGNGNLGASIYGGVKVDEIQFNEKSLWSGTSEDNGRSYGSYLNFGSLFIEDLNTCTSGVSNYIRWLDLDSAIAGVQYKMNGVTYTRQYLANSQLGCIIIRYSASKPGKLNLRIRLESGKPAIDAVTQYDAATLYEEASGRFEGKMQTLEYYAQFNAIVMGGNKVVAREDDCCTIRQADEVIIYLTGITNYDINSPSFTQDMSSLKTQKQLSQVITAIPDFSSIKDLHHSDYGSFYDRVAFRLKGAKNNDIPTDQLILHYAQHKGNTDPYTLLLERLYFNYGRYLALSSSRPNDMLPSNLQGIWNHSSRPPWNCDYHANINMQMNYWPMEPLNMSECHMPLLNFIIRMHEPWEKYARESGQTVGWTTFTENNIFGGVGAFAHNYVVGNAWLCTHLWQHFLYTNDTAFLRNAFPTMLSATQYWEERLKENANGEYICPQEYSPEHGPVEDGVAHAQQLVYELFSNTLSALAILGDESFGVSTSQIERLQHILDHMDKGLATEVYNGIWGDTLHGIAKGTEIMREWKESPFSVGEKNHRHLSHLMCLYPFSQPNRNLQAAINSLQMRGDMSTGWSMGWKINLWASAHDGNHAHKILTDALTHHSIGGGGVYFNLWDSHPPFQIDGNFGAIAGIANMIMQSSTNLINILPALPSAWEEGSLKGLKAVGGYAVDVAWSKKKVEVTLTAPSIVTSDALTIQYTNESTQITPTPNQTYHFSWDVR